MKRIIITILVFLTGMTVFAQSKDMSYYTDEFSRASTSFQERLRILENVKRENLTGIGEFYHSALKTVLTKIPDIKTREDWEANEASAKMICKGLAAEKYAPAAPDLWSLVQYSDIVRDVNDGLTMQEAFIALGQTGDKTYLPHIVLFLDDQNTQQISDAETRRRIQRAVVGAINALEALHEIGGYRPVFFTYVGWYDPAIKTIAYNALPNITDDPGEVIAEIIKDSSNIPSVKLRAWQEMLRTSAPDSSKEKVAAVALDVGWNYLTSNTSFQMYLKTMRMGAIDTIRVLGAADNSVYANLEKSYNNNFINNVPDYDEIRKTIEALSAVKTENGAGLLLKFLKDLHERRRSGVWGNKERQCLQWIIPALGASGTQSQEVRVLLNTIQRTQDYTSTEQSWARDALRQLGN